MKNKILFGMTAIAMGIGHGAGAQTSTDPRVVADGTGAVYFSALGQYDFLDKGRIAKDGTGYQVGIGYNFAPNWALEGNVSPDSFKITGAGYSEQIDAYSLDFLYKFLPGSLIRPYALLGPGLLEYGVGGHASRNQGALAEAGIGALTALGPQDGHIRL